MFAAFGLVPALTGFVHDVLHTGLSVAALLATATCAGNAVDGILAGAADVHLERLTRRHRDPGFGRS